MATRDRNISVGVSDCFDVSASTPNISQHLIVISYNLRIQQDWYGTYLNSTLSDNLWKLIYWRPKRLVTFECIGAI